MGTLKNERLIQLRQKAGWSQKELGEKVGFSQSMIHQIENGKKDPSRKYRLRLAKLFDVSVEWLFYEQFIDKDAEQSHLVERRDEDVLSKDARLPAHS